MAGGARYFVDGYNVLLRQRLGEGAPLAERRAELIARLAACGLSACVVFDSREVVHGARGSAPRRIEVVFAPPGRSADEVLLEKLRRAPDLEVAVLVSDDRELVERASFLGVRALGTAELGRRLKPAPASRAAHDRKLTRDEVRDWMRWFGYEKKPIESAPPREPPPEPRPKTRPRRGR